MKSTSRPIDASDTLALPDDADGASATTGASFKSGNPNSTTSNDGRELNNSNPAARRPEVLDADDSEGDNMPLDWTFPGFIAFALLGPIVHTCLLPYRSEIVMPTLPRTVPGDTTNGRAAMQSEKLVSKSLSTKKSRVVTASPSKSSAEVSLQQKIMVAGIAKSQMLWSNARRIGKTIKRLRSIRRRSQDKDCSLIS
jgi:hypothetical protein